MNVVIREAGPGELDQLMAWRMEVLSCVFAEEWDTVDRDALYEANLDYYKTYLERGEHVAVFAEVEGEPVACGAVCFYREMPSPDNASGWCAYLMNIYTRDAYRRQGIGEQVVQYLVGCAQQRGVEKVYLETSDSGRFVYEKLGFRDMNGYMKLPKGPEA